MPLTPSNRPGRLTEDLEIKIETQASDPAESGVIRYNGSSFRLRDATGVYDPRTGGSGLSEAAHRALLQLIHFIDEGPAEGFTSGATKTVTGTVFPSQVLWKRADASKLVEQNITWTGVNATTVEWKMYDTDGSTVLATVTDTIAYSGVFETGRTRSIA